MEFTKRYVAGYPISMLTLEEKEVLYKLFDLKTSNDIDEILEKKISKLLLPVGGTWQKGLSYEQMILKIATKRKIYFETNSIVYEKEQKLFLEIFKENYNEMNDAQKEAFLDDLKQKGLSKDQLASIATLATIGAAQFSGFAVYLLASSTVGAITSALGITLSFGFYTAMSSVISVAIGPIGWAIAAIPLYKSFKDVRSFDDLKVKLKDLYRDGGVFFKGNYDGAEVILKYFASLRIMKIREQELQIENNNKDNTHSSYRIKSLEFAMSENKASQIKLIKEISDLEFQLNGLRKEQIKLDEKETIHGKEIMALHDKQSELLQENERLKNEIENLKK